jgi:GH15 family glucan-1,4-alpha-glucosidase
MRRYEAEDDFGRPETAFNVCSFWRVDALARIGQHARARELFEALLARRNHVGLLSEDMSPATGELWGNFPADLLDGRHHQRRGPLSARWDDAV